jgi:hypothetical protein
MKLGKSDDLQTQMLADWQSRRNSLHLAVWGLFRGGLGGRWGASFRTALCSLPNIDWGRQK